MKRKKILIQLYRNNIEVIISPVNEIIKLAKKWEMSESDVDKFISCGAATLYPKGKIIIWSPSLKNFSELGHEIIHASMRILRDANIRVDEYNHEALTYLFTYICDELKL